MDVNIEIHPFLSTAYVHVQVYLKDWPHSMRKFGLITCACIEFSMSCRKIGPQGRCCARTWTWRTFWGHFVGQFSFHVDIRPYHEDWPYRCVFRHWIWHRWYSGTSRVRVLLLILLLHFFVCTQLVLRARTPTELQFANRLNPPLTEPSLHAPQMVDINKL